MCWITDQRLIGRTHLQTNIDFHKFHAKCNFQFKTLEAVMIGLCYIEKCMLCIDRMFTSQDTAQKSHYPPGNRHASHF